MKTLNVRKSDDVALSRLTKSTRSRLLIPLLVLLPFVLSAQDFKQYIFSSQGNYAESSTMSISWTIGDNFIETLSTGDGSITQGFQQPFLKLVEVKHPELLAFDAQIFPNPTYGKLSVSIKNNEATYNMEVFDIQGRMLLERKSSDPLSEIDLTPYATGTYFLRITDEKAKRTSLFEIVKL